MHGFKNLVNDDYNDFLVSFPINFSKRTHSFYSYLNENLVHFLFSTLAWDYGK